MSDEITIKPKSETSSTVSTQDNQNVSLSRVQILNICAAGLGVSFFLPWGSFLGTNPSGYDLQKYGHEQNLLWLIPILSTITIFAGIIKQGQKIAAIVTGIVPFCVGIYWYNQIGSDLFHVLAIGAYLSLIFGAALLALPLASK